MARRRKRPANNSFTDGEERTAYTLKHTFLVERRKFQDSKRLEPSVGEVKCNIDLKPKMSAGSDEHPEETAKSVESKDMIWLTIARKVIARRMDPGLFVRRYFASLHSDSKSPRASMMNSDTVFNNYDRGREASNQIIRVAFRIQTETAETEMCLAQQHEPKLTAWESVLTDDDIPISSLFRYCLALKIALENKSRRFKDVAEQYARLAALQYIEDPDVYDEVWGEWIPAGFRESSDVVYEEVYGT